MQAGKNWKKAGKDGSNSNVGRYIYIGKGEFRLSFLKLIVRSLLPTTASLQPGRALYSLLGSCPSTSAPAVN
ncbi:hypothetical protein [Microcoleus sp. N3A4]|uniref:hypothetical protein n=1 Tax=Microcoleus sp. N3A4 TaxID=3055379 RepID=UPI002FD79E9E